ncbi:unnamed protein product [Mycena citricolor]|uniref:mitogen-activated protein kinase kinase n=1 Tax=Mycena citricolor TaxID=2018698 RepID=A0AAD2H9V6_9AGAR|nr:unnamed protein product [Mycena citricolor]
MPRYSAQFPNLTGETVDGGRLKLVKVLGSGSYGIVYHALDTTSPAAKPDYYAVKCMGPPSDRVTQELELHYACADHDSVVTLHRHFVEQDHVFAVLDVMHCNMWHRIDNGAYWSEDLLKQTFIKILDGVRHIHEREVAHRDLKPENILCSKDGFKVGICDFGIAVDSTKLGMTSAGGTLAYMPPEALALGQTADFYDPQAADVWALCIIILNMIGGRCPWETASPSDLAWMTYVADPAYLKSKFPISNSLYQLLSRGLNPDPACRPSVLDLRYEIGKMKKLYWREEMDSIAAVSIALAAPLLSKAKKLLHKDQVSRLPPPQPPLLPSLSKLPPPESQSCSSNSSLAALYSVDLSSFRFSELLACPRTSTESYGWVAVSPILDSETDMVFASVRNAVMSTCASIPAWLDIEADAPKAKSALPLAGIPRPHVVPERPRPGHFYPPKLVPMLSSVSEKKSGPIRRLRHWLKRTQSA